MGIQSIGGSATVNPYKSQKPRFTLSTSYKNTAQSWNSNGNLIDMTYDPSTNTLLYTRGQPGGATTTTYDKFSLTSKTFSTGTLPTGAFYGARLQACFNGGLVYFPDSDSGSGLSVYYSSNSGSTWTDITNQFRFNDIIPMPSTLTSETNNSDVIPFMVKYGSTYAFYNATENQRYEAASVQTPNQWANSSNNLAITHTFVPLSRGADDFVFDGYYVTNAIDGGRRSTASWGTDGIFGFVIPNKRASWYGRTLQRNLQYTNSSTGFIPAYFVPQQAGQGICCVENRWLVGTMATIGSPLYVFDLEADRMVASPGFDIQSGTRASRPQYISSTKKLYIFSSNNQTMYEYDVTFE